MTKTLLTGLAALSLVTLGGCTAQDNAAVREDVQGVREQIRGAAENAQQAAANAALAGKIKSALETRKGLDADHIDVEVQSGVVTLKGDVASREQAELAERVTQATEGVQTVDNQLMVRVPAKEVPPSQTQTGESPVMGAPATETPLHGAPLREAPLRETPSTAPAPY